jgi:hypothetical protein
MPPRFPKLVNQETTKLSPRPLGDFAAALAFATIFAFATHVASLATTLAFAAIEALAIVLGHRGVSGGSGPVVRGFATRGGHCARNQARHGGRDDDSSSSPCHSIFQLFVFIV